VLVVLRDEGLRRRRRIVVAPVSTQIRNLGSEMPLGPEEGLTTNSVAQCDALLAVDGASMESPPIGRVGRGKLETLNETIRFALDIRCPPA
jgi:mRNA-degrading endonuclease toxin of MazEF toxin-antitoxin module